MDMTWEQIVEDWAAMQEKHRMEVVEAVARYCVGHQKEEVIFRLINLEKNDEPIKTV